MLSTTPYVFCISSEPSLILSSCQTMRTRLVDPSNILLVKVMKALYIGAQGVSFAHAMESAYRSSTSFVSFSLVSRELAIMCFIVVSHGTYRSEENGDVDKRCFSFSVILVPLSLPCCGIRDGGDLPLRFDRRVDGMAALPCVSASAGPQATVSGEDAQCVRSTTARFAATVVCERQRSPSRRHGR
jgi:hypothetical protein